jgi:hypothetical protein
MKLAMAFRSDPLVSFNVDRASKTMTLYLIKRTKVVITNKSITPHNMIY